MSKTEAIVGWIWVFVHSLVLAPFVVNFVHLALSSAGISLDEAQVNVIYYGISFVFLMIFLSGFMKASFTELTRHIGETFSAILFGYTFYFAASFAVAYALNFILGITSNPNQDAIDAQLKLNPNTMLAVGVFLGPVVEEVLFRGVVFGTIRRKNVILAYIVSALLFALYHLVSYFLDGFSWELVIMLVEYIPAGIILAWCYERGKNIYAPIFLHMIINLVSITVTLNV